MKYLLCLLTVVSVMTLGASTPKVAIVTVQVGEYDQYPCPVVPTQTIPVDKICFTNLKIENTNGWEIDHYPYHRHYVSPLDNGTYVNSLVNHNANRNIYKFYKMNLHRFPRMQKYDVIIWVDGSIVVKSPNIAKWYYNKLMKDKEDIVFWEHSHRKGFLLYEVMAARFTKACRRTNFKGQDKPKEDIASQYLAYLDDGYNDIDYWSKRYPDRIHCGVWVSSCFAFRQSSQKAKDLLDLWYLQILKYTTHDQIGLPYALQKLEMKPYTLPDKDVKGEFQDNAFTTMQVLRVKGKDLSNQWPEDDSSD